MNTNFFSSNFSDTPRISQQSPGISRQRSLISPVSRDMPNFLAPTPSCGRPPPRQKISGLKSLGLGSFSCLINSPSEKSRKGILSRVCVFFLRSEHVFFLRSELLAVPRWVAQLLTQIGCATCKCCEKDCLDNSCASHPSRMLQLWSEALQHVSESFLESMGATTKFQKRESF